MWRTIIAVGIVMVVASQAAEENPFKKAKEGDWTEYSITRKVSGATVAWAQKRIVTKVTATEVTVEVVTIVSGQKDTKDSYTIKLNEPYDYFKTYSESAKSKATATGEDKLVVKGSSLNTKWTEYELDNGGKVRKHKMWISTELPLDGVVKSETTLTAADTLVTELKDYGVGK